MLSELRIQNLVLIESAHILFAEGLNVITGETGAGKSAVMASLGLISGQRADLSMIRHGCTKGSVEAVFDITPCKELTHLLQEAGIEAPGEEPLIIKREIAAAGKGRAYLNHQPIHVSFLRTITPLLFELVGQHANHTLFSTDSHRQILDLFGSLGGQVREFSQSWHQETLLRQEKEELIALEAQRCRDIDRFRAELEEIEEANLKEGEEEELFAEYTRLINASELSMKVESLNDALSGETKPIIPSLRQQLKTLDELIELDPSLEEAARSYQAALAELEEASYTLRSYASGIENNPERAEELDQRLGIINKLKRKYGVSIEEIKKYESDLVRQLELLETASDRVEAIDEELQATIKKNNALAELLTAARSEIAAALSDSLTCQLQTLNMPDVELTVRLEQQKRCQYGDDRVEFYIKPNKGEGSIPVKECASGGELSRLLLSIRTLLAGKQAVPCLIFDEVDANIGGETATIVGEKLGEIASRHQVLCITHFPQVAIQADHHLQISKSEQNGRTVTTVQSVKGAAKEKELARMRG